MKIFLMLLIIISVIIHTLMFLVEKESKREGVDMFSYCRLMHNSAKKKNHLTLNTGYLELESWSYLSVGNCRTWQEGPSPGSIYPETSISCYFWSCSPLSTLSLLCPSLLPSLCLTPLCLSSHPALTYTVGEELFSLLNETTVQIPIVFRTSGLPMQRSQGHSSTCEQF